MQQCLVLKFAETLSYSLHLLKPDEYLGGSGILLRVLKVGFEIKAFDCSGLNSRQI